MNIRLATSADIPSIIAIEQCAVAASHWSAEKYQEMFTAEVPIRIVLVIEADSLVKGFLVARTLGEEWEIENIAVARDSQRCGLGAQLLRDLLVRARREKAATILLEVRETNRAARALYKKFSFEECSTRTGYYHDPEEYAVVYQLYL